MSDTRTAARTERQPGALERYYQFHSRIYDATRWSFLFGRTAIFDRLPRDSHPASVLEVGCGTGKNLVTLAARFPGAQITGVDLSDVMLGIARTKTAGFGGRVQLQHRAYDAPLQAGAHDLVVFSYALTMFNPGWETAISAAHADLKSGGRIAVVDFHDSAFPAFKRWMGVNHVRMDGHLLPLLRSTFKAEVEQTHAAYGGVWRYLMFVGRKD